MHAYCYTGLAASLGYGAASEILRRTTSSSNGSQPSSLLLTESNVKRLVAKLTQMRGAALKMGQFLSIQGKFMIQFSCDRTEQPRFER